MSDIWVLTDHRAGTATQAIALAESLDLQYEVKNIVYNSLASIPNFLLGGNLIHIKRNASSDISGDLPKIIISAGRRTASIAVALKRKNPDIKIIQIMRPFLDPKYFDLIILPQHDTFNIEAKNVLRIIGSLHNVQSKLPQEASLFKKNYPTMDNFIALLIGGGTKKYIFTHEDGQQLANVVTTISRNHGLPLFISFSRRTPDYIKQIFYESFPWPHVIYDPTTSSTSNPYYGMLASSTFIISTCDSISMCSEATATNKPLYIFCPSTPNALPKHKYFIQQLVDLGIARILEQDTQTLQHYTYSSFHEAQKVAKHIKEYVL